MRTDSMLSDVQTSDDIEPIDFTIESSPLAFEILSAGIYTDRALAPVRELMCNAIDAHADAENLDTPYIVHLPNTLEPFWSIRDYGTGLPPEMVKKLYTRYFKSTKTKSNTPIGFMGLGSKSPFAYVESFNVTSYWNGMKYMYSAYRNELKMPCVAPLGEEPTDEPNGMEISFNVGRYDYFLFQEKTKQALKFFERIPTVLGVHNFKIPPTEYLLRGNEYGITKNKENASYIVMANVGYTFDPKDFANTPEALSPRETKMVQWGIHLFVPNGTVMPAASREKITWTEKARIAVKESLVKATNAIEEEAKKTLANVNSIWDARIAISKAKTGILGEIINVSDFIEWNGHKISEVVYVNYISNPPTLIESMVHDDNAGYKYYRRQATKMGDYYRTKCDSFSCAAKVFFINDLKRGGYIAAKRYMEEKKIESAIIFSGDVQQEFIDEVGCGHLTIKTSTLPKPPRAARGSGPISDRTMIQKWSSYGEWSDVEVDLEDGGVYFEVRRSKVKRQFKGSQHYDFVSAGELQRYVNAVQSLDDEDEIYVIRPCDLNKIQNKKYDGWITYYDHMEDVLKRHASLLDDARKLLTLDTMRVSDIELMRKFAAELSDDSEMKKAILVYEDLLLAVPNRAKAQAFNVLNEYHELYTITTIAESASAIKNVYDHYPLLKYTSIHGDNAVKHAIEYIKIMDEKRVSNVTAEAA